MGRYRAVRTMLLDRITHEWELARSSFYHQRTLVARPDRVPWRRGPKTAWSDAALLEKTRAVLAARHSTARAIAEYGPGCALSACARRRRGATADERSADAGAVAYAQKRENPHRGGTILTARPNEVWASKHTLTATVEEGQVMVFVAVDHCTTECLGPARGQESHTVRRPGTAAAERA